MGQIGQSLRDYSNRRANKTFAYWTTKEHALLRQYYGKWTAHELIQALPRHTAKAITKQAGSLGLRIQRDWEAIAAAHVFANYKQLWSGLT